VSDEEQHSQQLTVMMTEIATKMQVLLDKQDELAENINKIKEAVYNPDEGLYARLRNLEQWKETSSKITWVILTSIVGLATATVWHTFFK